MVFSCFFFFFQFSTIFTIVNTRTRAVSFVFHRAIVKNLRYPPISQSQVREFNIYPTLLQSMEQLPLVFGDGHRAFPTEYELNARLIKTLGIRY